MPQVVSAALRKRKRYAPCWGKRWGAAVLAVRRSSGAKGLGAMYGGSPLRHTGSIGLERREPTAARAGWSGVRRRRRSGSKVGHASVTPDGSNARRVSSSAVRPRAPANPVYGGGRPSTGFSFASLIDQAPSGPLAAVPLLLLCFGRDHNVGSKAGERAENSSALQRYPLTRRKRVRLG